MAPPIRFEASRLQVLHEPRHDEVVLLLGPHELPATGNTMRLTRVAPFSVPVGGWLTGLRIRVLDSGGRELPDTLLHHINLIRPDRRELFLPVMQRLAAAGEETEKIGVPFPFGVPVEAGDTLLVVAMLHNPTGRPVEVTVEARLRYDTQAWLNRIGVQPFYLDVRPPPEEAGFDLPPGRSTHSWEGSPAIDVEVLALGAHVHAFAREIRLEELGPDGSRKVIWRSRPELALDGRIVKIPRGRFLLRLGLGLSADRSYRLVAVYDNPTGATIPDGGMAEIAGVVLPRGEWPAAGPATSDRYRADCLNLLRDDPRLANRFCGSGPEGLPR